MALDCRGNTVVASYIDTEECVKERKLGSVRKKSYKIPEVITGVQVIIDFPIAIQAPQGIQAHSRYQLNTRERLLQL